MSTAKSDPTTLAQERNLAQRAAHLFVTSYGLTWEDAFRAAQFEEFYGPEKLTAALALVAADGCDFDTAALITMDPELSAYQAAWDREAKRLSLVEVA